LALQLQRLSLQSLSRERHLSFVGHLMHVRLCTRHQVSVSRSQSNQRTLRRTYLLFHLDVVSKSRMGRVLSRCKMTPA
jgi:hypothetical protein